MATSFFHRFRLGLTIGLLAVLAAAPLRSAGVASAAPAAAIEPEAIALTPADLIPGFVVDESATERKQLEHEIGVQFKRELRREESLANPLSGPVIVSQIIIRVDKLLVPADLLAEVRDTLIRDQGLAPIPGAPNDGGTISLGRQEGPVALYAVGFVKNEMVIFTLWAGHESVVNLPGLLALAGISSARYDSLQAQGS